MNGSAVEPSVYEFAFPALDTFVRVEAAGEAVVICASRDTFSEDRRQRFIRELAAEGFIPDHYRWLGSPAPGSAGRVVWLVDTSGFMPGPARIAHTRRLMLGLFGGSLLLWLLLMGALFAGAAG